MVIESVVEGFEEGATADSAEADKNFVGKIGRWIIPEREQKLDESCGAHQKSPV